MQSITPLDPSKRNVIIGYGDGGFTVSGHRLEGGIAILPNAVRAWPHDEARALTVAALAPILEADTEIEVLIVGTGPAMEFLPPSLNKALRAKNIGFETMDTGAACRTYNVLVAEDRRVAALLMAV